MALKHAHSGEVVDLRPLGERLNNFSSHALVKTDEFEAIRLIIPAGDHIPPHKVSGQITLHCTEGQVSIGMSESTIELGAHQWIFLEGGKVHSIKARKDSALLLTILF